jgi:hypothetical protein
MILEETFFLPPSLNKRWHEVKRLRCSNCNCIKIYQQWSDTKDEKHFEVTKKNADDLFLRLKTNAIYTEHKVHKGTKGGMGFRFGKTIPKHNTKTGITTFFEYSIDFNNTKELVRQYEA